MKIATPALERDKTPLCPFAKPTGDLNTALSFSQPGTSQDSLFLFALPSSNRDGAVIRFSSGSSTMRMPGPRGPRSSYQVTAFRFGTGMARFTVTADDDTGGTPAFQSRRHASNLQRLFWNAPRDLQPCRVCHVSSELSGGSMQT